MLIDIVECEESDILLVVPEGSPTAKLLMKEGATRLHRGDSGLRRRSQHHTSRTHHPAEPQTS